MINLPGPLEPHTMIDRAHSDQKGRLLSGNWLPKTATSPWLTIKLTVRLLGGGGGVAVLL